MGTINALRATASIKMDTGEVNDGKKILRSVTLGQIKPGSTGAQVGSIIAPLAVVLAGTIDHITYTINNTFSL